MSRLRIAAPKLLAILALIASACGMIVPALAQTKETANRSRSLNNLKQIALATLNYDAVHRKFPTIVDHGIGAASGFGVISLHLAILPYCEGNSIFQVYQVNNPRTAYSNTGAVHTVFRPYISPADPTAQGIETTAAIAAPGAKSPFEATFTGHYATTSYPANGMLFVPGFSYKKMIDGSATTIMFAERYQVCKTGAGLTPPTEKSTDTYTLWGLGAYSAQAAAFALKPAANDSIAAPIETAKPNAMFVPLDSQSANTAVRGFWASQPAALITWSPTSIPGAPGGFQVAPRGAVVCDSRVPNTPHPEGMLVALGDGSARSLSAKISAVTFWSAVTPTGAEVFGPDWDEGLPSRGPIPKGGAPKIKAVPKSRAPVKKGP